jgi:hypothetical protein
MTRRLLLVFLLGLVCIAAWWSRTKWQARGADAEGRITRVSDVRPWDHPPPPPHPDEARPDIGDSARRFVDYRRGIREDSLEEQARALAIVAINSIKGFYSEYKAWPLPANGAPREVIPLRTDHILTRVLFGMDTATNPKKINFLPDLKPVERGKGPGLLTEGEMCALVDPWGEEYYVLLDADYSSTIENPNPSSTQTKLSQGVLIWSAGPDKDPSTWQDNVTSWDNGMSGTNSNRR